MNPLHTWSTWDVRCLNAVMKVPELAEVRLIAYDQQTRQVVEELRWESLVRLGTHSVNGSYFEIVLKIWKNTFELAFSSEGDQFTLRLAPSECGPTLRFYVTGLFRWNSPGTIEHNTEASFTLTHSASSRPYHITTIGALDLTTPINTTYMGILVDGALPFYVRCNHELNSGEMDEQLAREKITWQNNSIRGGGWLADAPEAAFKGMIWNTIYEPIHKRFCTPVTREWCVIKPERPFFGSFVLFIWDTLLASLLTALQDEALTYTQIDSLLMGMTGDRLPLLTSEVNTYSERSQPPVGAYCVLKLYRQFENISLLKNTFENLLAWHGWWMKHRDGNGDGLLEWGTDLEYYGEEYLAFYLNESRSEAGLDNSPMYDGTRFNPNAHTLELADVGLNSLYALDCWALAEIAALLVSPDTPLSGDDKDNLSQLPEKFLEIETSLRTEYEEMSERINSKLWNDDLGIYCNQHWDGCLDETLSPTSFYPLLAGIASSEQAQRMINEHLLNPLEFWGEYVLPTSTRNHPAFKDNNYWRGRIWAPTNFLVGEGLKRYGFDEVAHEFARKSLELFNGEWQAECHIHENYNSLTGDGDDVENADPVYTWGGLLALMGASELAEAQPWGGLRFGNLGGIRYQPGEAASFQRIRFADSFYDISIDGGLQVIRNNLRLLESDIPVLITHFILKAPRLSFCIRSRQIGALSVVIPEGIQSLVVEVNGQPYQWEVFPGQAFRVPL